MNPAHCCLLLLVVGCAVAQRSYTALEELYNATQGDTWLNNSNWLAGDPCKDWWFGILCANDTIIYM